MVCLPLRRCIVFLPTTLPALVLSRQSVEIKRRSPVHNADDEGEPMENRRDACTSALLSNTHWQWVSKPHFEMMALHLTENRCQLR
jgi:hypothetical protein